MPNDKQGPPGSGAPRAPKIKRKHQPRGFEILHEDPDLIVGNKAPGFLTVSALWNKDDTIHSALNHYVRKGNSKSRKSVYVVHRLDQATSGVLIFAKSEDVQHYLKDNWPTTLKTYYTIVHGKLEKKSGRVTSYLSEDEDYHVHSSRRDDGGKLAVTEYEVLRETDKYSLVKINLLTGRKNQIRVHMAELGHPIVGDEKYGHAPVQQSSRPQPQAGRGGANKRSGPPSKNLALHSYSIEFTHPFSKKRVKFTAPVPESFRKLVDYEY